MCQDGGNTIKSSGFSERHTDAEGRKQARPWPHTCKQQSIQWPLYSGSLNAAVNYSLCCSETSGVQIRATLTNLSLENFDSDPTSVWFALDITSKYRQGQANNTFRRQATKGIYSVLFQPCFNMLQNCWALQDCTGGEKTGENRQMSMLIMVISLWEAVVGSHHKICELLLPHPTIL